MPKKLITIVVWVNTALVIFMYSMTEFYISIFPVTLDCMCLYTPAHLSVGPKKLFSRSICFQWSFNFCCPQSVLTLYTHLSYAGTLLVMRDLDIWRGCITSMRKYFGHDLPAKSFNLLFPYMPNFSCPEMYFLNILKMFSMWQSIDEVVLTRDIYTVWSSTVWANITRLM